MGPHPWGSLTMACQANALVTPAIGFARTRPLHALRFG